uniref:protein-disulfide reductase n=1 Tax=Noccaea caerulescens TaxID=107243 RepID=A0A1J3HEK6_NOCCA
MFQVKIDSLKGKKNIGLYFSASWCGPCHMFTPQLVEAYNELSPKAGFEVVFVSCDKDEESFVDYFAKMPWLAVPFSDPETRDGLYDEIFKVKSIPNLVILDDHGEVVNENGCDVVIVYGANAYPFTPKRVKEIKKEQDRDWRQRIKEVQDRARRERTIESDEVTMPEPKRRMSNRTRIANRRYVQ